MVVVFTVPLNLDRRSVALLAVLATKYRLANEASPGLGQPGKAQDENGQEDRERDNDEDTH
jgi:hypothetical protein